MIIKKRSVLIVTALICIGAVILFLCMPTHAVHAFIPKEPGIIIDINVDSKELHQHQAEFKLFSALIPRINGCIQMLPAENEKVTVLGVFNIGSFHYILRLVPLFFSIESNGTYYTVSYKKEAFFFRFYDNILLISCDEKTIDKAIERSHDQNNTIDKNDDYLFLRKLSQNTGIFMFSDLYNSTAPPMLSSLPIPLPINIAIQSIAADINVISNEIQIRMYMPGKTSDPVIFSSISSLLSTLTFFTAKKDIINDIEVAYVPSVVDNVECAFCTTEKSLHIASHRNIIKDMVNTSNTYIYPIYLYGDHTFANYLVYGICVANQYDPKPFLNKIDSIRGYMNTEKELLNLHVAIRPHKNIAELLDF